MLKVGISMKATIIQLNQWGRKLLHVETFIVYCNRNTFTNTIHVAFSQKLILKNKMQLRKFTLIVKHSAYICQIYCKYYRLRHAEGLRLRNYSDDFFSLWHFLIQTASRTRYMYIAHVWSSTIETCIWDIRPAKIKSILLRYRD